MDPLQISLPGLGERKTPGRAIEQARTEMGLQVSNELVATALEMSSNSAARTKLPCSTTLANTRIDCSRSIFQALDCSRKRNSQFRLNLFFFVFAIFTLQSSVGAMQQSNKQRTHRLGQAPTSGLSHKESMDQSHDSPAPGEEDPINPNEGHYHEHQEHHRCRLLLAAAGAAMAEAPYPPETPFQSTQTRADVKAELQRAQANHEIASRNEYPIIHQAPRN
jgi:hypothetical protein